MSVDGTERPWSAADVLSVTEAARRLPIREAQAIAIVRSVARPVPGTDRELVIWGDVLDLLRSGSAEPPPKPRASLPRAGLRRKRANE